MRFKFVLIFMSLLSSFLVKAKEINLYQASLNGDISCEAKALGGYSGEVLSLTIQSLRTTSLSVKIEAGTIFICEDKGAQNLMITKAVILKLYPKEIKTQNLSANCIERMDYAPSIGLGYVLGEMANKDLANLATLISDKSYINSTAQSAIWAITDNYPIEYIYALDTVMAKELAIYVSVVTGQPMPIIIKPKAHNIVSIKANIGFRLLKDEELDFVLLNETGEEVESFYTNRKEQEGLFIYKIGINRVDDAGQKYKMVVKRSGGNVLYEKVVSEESSEDVISKEQARVEIKYSITTPQIVSLYVEDLEGNIVTQYYKYKRLPISNKIQLLKFDYLKGIEKHFRIKMVNSKGKIIVNQSVDL